MTRSLVTSALLCLALSQGPPLHASSQTHEAARLVEQTSSAASRLAQEAQDKALLKAQLSALFSEVVDFRRFAARTLSGDWEALSEEQRARFESAFRALVMSIYAKRFRPGLVFKTTLRGEAETLGTHRLKVRTTLSGPKAGADLDYELERLERDKRQVWRITDLIIDGVSMVQSWRKAFKRALDKDGFEALVTKIERKASRR